MFEGVPAVEDPGAAAEGGDGAQRQHGVVCEQGGRLRSEAGQHRAVPAVLEVAQHQNLPAIIFLAWEGDMETQLLLVSPS